MSNIRMRQIILQEDAEQLEQATRWMQEPGEIVSIETVSALVDVLRVMQDDTDRLIVDGSEMGIL